MGLPISDCQLPIGITGTRQQHFKNRVLEIGKSAIGNWQSRY